jgi:hypothetical protein
MEKENPDLVAAEPVQQRFQACEDCLGKFLPGDSNYIGLDANSVAAEPQQHTRWILLSAFSSSATSSWAASYDDSIEPDPIIVLLQWRCWHH